MASLKAAQDNNIVLPLTHPSGGPKAYRLEIDEFLADNAMTNLFLLALEAMQKHSIKKPGSNDANWWSFYSLAGIHGAPREDWAEVEKRTMGGGYCHHGMSTFPTWHRPYIFQFEQAVYNQMQIIADEFEDEVKHKYLDALSRFRLPYWDLCMPRHSDKNLAPEKIQRAGGWRWGFPAILKAESVHVRRPKTPNKLEPIDNPLYQFKFPENAEYTGVKPTRPKINWERTLIKWVMRRTPDNKIVRKPDDTPIFDPVDGKTDVTIRTPTKANKGNSDYAKLETKIQQQTQVMATNIWHMLNPEELGEDPITEKPIPTMKINQLRSWDDFASHAIQDPRFKGLTVQSIESWHDSIHNLIGTGDGYNGQMADTSVAAFDPVFWLHHNNIDRLFAIYQALYPDKYVTPGKHAEQNPPLNGDDPILYADDQLYPFKKNSDECYTSADIRDWKNTGFAVPGDQELTPEGVKKVEQYLRDTYYW
jgi:tyrosinase